MTIATNVLDADVMEIQWPVELKKSFSQRELTNNQSCFTDNLQAIVKLF